MGTVQAIAWFLLGYGTTAVIRDLFRRYRSRMRPVTYINDQGHTIPLALLRAMASESEHGWCVWISPAATMATIRFGEGPAVLYQRARWSPTEGWQSPGFARWSPTEGWRITGDKS